MRVVVLGSSANTTNVDLVRSWRGLGLEAELVPAVELERHVGSDVVVVARLDVLPSLNGVEPGLLELLWVERRGALVVNGSRALLACHDKLHTARILRAAGLPHPRTSHLRPGQEPALEPPLVVKPRFGSWGRDVFRCSTGRQLEHVLREVRDRQWFRRHGALLQELEPPRGEDVRLVIAGGRIAGAIRRASAPGEWRTNVSLGGSAHPYDPTPDVIELGLAAARAVDADFVGVDLLPLDDGSHVVLELNGAVEFLPEYGLHGTDAHAEVAVALGLLREEEDVVLGANRVSEFA